MGNMAAFSDIGCPLIRYAHPDDALVNNIHEFKFQNIPMIDQPMFALLATSIVDTGLGGMEFLMCNFKGGEVFIVEE